MFYQYFLFLQLSCKFYSLTRYGDMPAHNLLWRECEKTSDNVAARLAAIPLVQVICKTLLFYSLCKHQTELHIVFRELNFVCFELQKEKKKVKYSVSEVGEANN